MSTLDIKSLKFSEVSKIFRLNDNFELEKLFKTGWKVRKLVRHSLGYTQIMMNGEYHKLHRILYCLQAKSDIPLGYVIDHIDGDRGNDCISNLRITTVRENTQNGLKQRNGKLLGYTYNKKAKSFYSKITINKKSIFLGAFESKEMASKCYHIAFNNLNKYVGNNSEFRKLIYKEMNMEV